MTPDSPPLLYGITDNVIMPGESLFSKSEQALKAGTKWLQYRNKNQPFSQRRAQASKLLALCNKYQASLIINDDVELAVEVGANGVHLGQGDGCIKTARERLGPKAIIGSTCHDSLELARLAEEQGASYVAFGRFFPSRTKPNAKPASMSLLTQAKNRFGCPIVVIGGITPGNASQLLSAGGTTLAVCHSLFGGDDVKYRAQQFLELA